MPKAKEISKEQRTALREAHAEILQRNLPELAQFVSDELAKVAGLVYGTGEAHHIAQRLALSHLAHRGIESGLLQSLKTTNIVFKIRSLYTFVRPDNITLRDVFTLFKSDPHFLQWKGETLQKQIQLLSDLFCAGDLKPPVKYTKLIRSKRDAYDLIFGTGCYIVLACDRSEIYSMAMLMRLDRTLDLHMTRGMRNSQRYRAINALLNNGGKGISDQKWAEIEHLAAGAAFKRPIPMTPGRKSAFQQAMENRRATSKPQP
jgi:hypothetical protein